MKVLTNIVIKSSLALPYIYDKILAIAYKHAMKYCGDNVYIRPSTSDFKGLNNLSVGGGEVASQKDQPSIVLMQYAR